jgi:hypothetical protein
MRMTERAPAEPSETQPEPLADLVDRVDQLETSCAQGGITDADSVARGRQLAQDIEARRSRLGIYEHSGDIYRAHRLGEHDGRYGGYIADLALDNENPRLKPETPASRALP